MRSERLASSNTMRGCHQQPLCMATGMGMGGGGVTLRSWCVRHYHQAHILQLRERAPPLHGRQIGARRGNNIARRHRLSWLLW